jgi:hypothetical protein
MVELFHIDEIPDPFKERWVPVLYRGKFDKQKFLELREGKETMLVAKRLHIKEGIVITTETPRKAIQQNFHCMLSF